MKVTKSHEEDALFENMFEVILKDDYENHYRFREQEKAEIDRANRVEFQKAMNLGRGSIKKRKGRKVKVDLLTGKQWHIKEFGTTRNRNTSQLNNKTSLPSSQPFGSQLISPKPKRKGSNNRSDNRFRTHTAYTPERRHSPDIMNRQDLTTARNSSQIGASENPQSQLTWDFLSEARRGILDAMTTRNKPLDSSPFRGRSPARSEHLGSVRKRSRSRSGSGSSCEPKTTRVIEGHAMAIRDLNIGTYREHKLESQGKKCFI